MTTGIQWPSKDEYDIAISRWRENVLDADIRNGTLDFDAMGIRRYGGANLYICIYRVSDWMVRCFCTNPRHPIPLDIQERYQIISHSYEKNAKRVSALIPITYVEQGIYVGGRLLPLVKMPFLTNCPSLGEFIMDNYQDSAVMLQLCTAWQRMVRELETACMAHGDLDLTNVLVQSQNQQLVLRLIDYDNMWLPELGGRTQTEHGHLNFQHPAFMPPRPRPYNLEMDRFSALVIYISLRAIAARPELYEEWGANEDDRLLFSEDDYSNAGLAGSRIMQLHQLNISGLAPYLNELNAALREWRMPRKLDEFTHRQTVPLWQAETTPLPAALPSKPMGLATTIWNQAVYTPTSNPGTAAPFTLPPPVSLPRRPAGQATPPPLPMPSWEYFTPTPPTNTGAISHPPAPSQQKVVLPQVHGSAVSSRNGQVREQRATTSPERRKWVLITVFSLSFVIIISLVLLLLLIFTGII